jgi:hypothetical protein
MRAGAGPENIAEMAVAMQAYPRGIVGGKKRGFDGREQISRDGEERLAQFFRHDIVLFQIAHRPVAEFLDAKACPVAERLGRAQPVQPAEISPEQGTVIARVQFRRASRLPRKDGKTKTAVMIERRAITARQRCHGGDFVFGQLLREDVFFEDGGLVPAAGAVELGHAGCAIFSIHTVDTVFVAVEREQPPGTAHAIGFHGLEDDLRR